MAMDNIKLTMVTAIWNGYGRFVPQYMDSIKKQEIKPDEIIFVLSKKHGVSEIPKGVIVVDEPKLLTLGGLLNKGIMRATGDWIFCFAVDDILLPNAIKEIKETAQHADVVAIKYNDRGMGTRSIPTITWNGRTFSKGGEQTGYIAFRKTHLEDTHVWKWEFLYRAMSLGKTIQETPNVCVKYMEKSGGIIKQHGTINSYVNIEHYRKKYSRDRKTREKGKKCQATTFFRKDI